MTNEEREQVVELLRCAADALLNLGLMRRVVGVSHASLAWAQGALDKRWTGTVGFRHAALEAAQRVEEGSWP